LTGTNQSLLPVSQSCAVLTGCQGQVNACRRGEGVSAPCGRPLRKYLNQSPLESFSLLLGQQSWRFLDQYFIFVQIIIKNKNWTFFSINISNINLAY